MQNSKVSAKNNLIYFIVFIMLTAFYIGYEDGRSDKHDLKDRNATTFINTKN